MRETAGRTAATAARCKNCRRGGFIWCLVGELRRVRGGAWVLVLPAACVGRYVKPQLNIGNCECRELCRFSDAGDDDLATRSAGRRPKSAKARNRGGGWCGGGAAGGALT